MLKLIDILLKKYSDEECIYFSWDTASWHASKELYKRIDQINGKAHQKPKIVLLPLPVSAQFLNVIESIYSGMARAIIHNSDYQSVNECKIAIDRYFLERNEHFKEYPKRAGNKIWGKERVNPYSLKAIIVRTPGTCEINLRKIIIVNDNKKGQLKYSMVDLH